MDLYALTGELSLAKEGEANNPAGPVCLLVGDRVFEATRGMHELLKSLQEPADLLTISQRLSDLLERPMEKAQIAQILHGQLIPLGLVRQGEHTPPRRRASFLLFRAELLSGATVNRLAGKLVGLLSPRLLLAAALWNVLLMIVGWAGFDAAAAVSDSSWSQWPARDIALGLALLLGCIFLHELGHAAACINNKIRPSGIGLGLHLMFPVLYCDVSRSWALPRRGRIEVGLGGCAMQLWGCAVVGSLALITGRPIYFGVWAANLTSMLITLNPWLRFDGYWLFCDYFGLKNLSAQASEYRVRCWQHLFGALPAGEIAKTSAILKAYAVSSHLFLAALIAWAASHLWTALPGYWGQVTPTLHRLLSGPTPELVIQSSWAVLWSVIYGIGLVAALSLLGREAVTAFKSKFIAAR